MLWFFSFLTLLFAVLALWHFIGFVLGETYDYLTRKKTYNGTKFIIFGLMYLVAREILIRLL